jgi:hypothetical protein
MPAGGPPSIGKSAASGCVDAMVRRDERRARSGQTTLAEDRREPHG